MLYYFSMGTHLSCVCIAIFFLVRFHFKIQSVERLSYYQISIDTVFAYVVMQAYSMILSLLVDDVDYLSFPPYYFSIGAIFFSILTINRIEYILIKDIFASQKRKLRIINFLCPMILLLITLLLQTNGWSARTVGVFILIAVGIASLWIPLCCIWMRKDDIFFDAMWHYNIWTLISIFSLLLIVLFQFYHLEAFALSLNIILIIALEYRIKYAVVDLRKRIEQEEYDL